MKTTLKHHQTALALICACGLLTTGTALAQNTRGGETRNARSTTAARTGQTDADTEKLRVTRASYFLGSDVVATDGKKVGDIVDYYFDLSGTPHLAYVVIMTGGFLDMGGDRRAVPASAITATGDACRINVSSSKFWDVPVLPENRQRFLSDPQNRQRLTQLFQGGSQERGSRQASNTSPQSSSQANTAAAADDPNQPGAMTGRAGSGQTRLVSFNELRNADAYGQQDSRLGFFVDAWVNLNDNRAPYVEIVPTFQPFRTNYDRRYAVPTAKLAQKREFYGYNVNITTEQLNQAEPVTETEGVKMLQEGRFGNDVLRVTLPER